MTDLLPLNLGPSAALRRAQLEQRPMAAGHRNGNAPPWSMPMMMMQVPGGQAMSHLKSHLTATVSSDHLEIGPELTMDQWRIQEFRKGGPKGELRCKNGHEIKSAERRRRVASYD